MKRNESITRLMTPDPIMIHINQKLSKVRELLMEYSIQHIPVIADNQLVGIISSTDMLRLDSSAFGANDRAMNDFLDSQYTITDVMQEEVVSLEESSTIRQAAEVLARGQFHAVPIVDENNQLVGIVSSTDIIRYLLDQY